MATSENPAPAARSVPHWVCYTTLGKNLAAGPYWTCDRAREELLDIAGYEGVTAAFVHTALTPPPGYVSLYALPPAGHA